MAYIILQNRWRRQPTSPVGIDWSHPIAMGLAVAVVPGIDPRNIANNQWLYSVKYNTAFTKRAIPGGIAALYSNYLEEPSERTYQLNTNGYSIFQAFVSQTLNNTNKGTFGLRQTTGGAYVGGFYQDNSSASYRGVFWHGSGFSVLGQPTGGALTSDTFYRVGLSHFTSNAVRLYSNGVGSAGTSTAISSNNVGALSLGSTNDSSTEPSSSTPLLIHLMWLRPLSDGEHAEIALNPWQIFRPITRRIYVPSAGTGGGTGTLAVTLGALTGSAAGTLAIAGTSAVTLGALTSTASGKLDIKGTAAQTLGAVTVAASGTLASAGTGTAAITLGGVTSAATGAVAIKGVAGIQLGSLTVAAAGLQITGDTRIGSAAITLADLTMAAMSAPLVARLGNRRLREGALRMTRGALPTGRVKRGGLPRIS